MKPDPKNIGRHVRMYWPGQPEHGQVGQITQAMQNNYVVAWGSLLITLPPESLTPVEPTTGWVTSKESL